MKIEPRALQVLLLQTRCIAARINPVGVLAAASFGVGVLCCGLWLPYLRQDLAQIQREVTRVTALNRTTPELTAAAPSQNELRMQQFYATLGESGYAEQQLKTMFDLAARSGLKLNQGEYKSSYERNSDTESYQIQLPVVGAYPAIREFCEAVLLAIPFASLDEISFKRDAIASNNLEAKLRFTLYLSASKKAGQP